MLKKLADCRKRYLAQKSKRPRGRPRSLHPLICVRVFLAGHDIDKLEEMGPSLSGAARGLIRKALAQIESEAG